MSAIKDKLQLLASLPGSYAFLASRALAHPKQYRFDLVRLLVLPAFLLLAICMALGIITGGILNQQNSRVKYTGKIYQEGESGEFTITSDLPASVSKGLALVPVPGAVMYVQSPAEVTVSGNTITLNSGLLLLETTAEVNLKHQDQTLTFPAGLLIMLDSANSQFSVLRGEFKLSADLVIEENESLILTAETAEVQTLDRSVFTREERYATAYKLMSDNDILPEELADITPPKLESIQPDNKAVDTATVTITGKTDPGSKVTINNAPVSVNQEGTFTQSLPLQAGKNVFTIISRDDAGNAATDKRTYTRSEQPVATATPAPTATAAPTATQAPPATATAAPTSTPGCSGDFVATLRCLINNHRTANGKNPLSAQPQLNQAAADHSEWMDANDTLNHTGEGGSSPWDRCAAAGTSCDAENVAFNSNPTAQNIFNQWKNSSGHNQNMLGDHNLIGLGRSGGYVTAVFQ